VGNNIKIEFTEKDIKSLSPNNSIIEFLESLSKIVIYYKLIRGELKVLNFRRLKLQQVYLV
jgi:hypothetical protein